MLFGTLGQLPVFLWMAGAGALMGAWYAVLAGVRRLLAAGVLLGLCADLAFGVGAAAIFCLGLYAANLGELRLYAALAAALGFAIFACGVYPPGKKAAFGLMAIFRKIVVKIRRHRWINVIFR
ncbi:MAG: hypothetical protein IJ646_10405 [Clostridia bacterium]|nr:hypothetical protein [Clostridia bacterium]